MFFFIFFFILFIYLFIYFAWVEVLGFVNLYLGGYLLKNGIAGLKIELEK